MTGFSTVTDADLARARQEPEFRQRLLEESLETLLAGIQHLRNGAPSGMAADAKQMREAVELAVRLAELIQTLDAQSNDPSRLCHRSA
jgi:hypothetical protein